MRCQPSATATRKPSWSVRSAKPSAASGPVVWVWVEPADPDGSLADGSPEAGAPPSGPGSPLASAVLPGSSLTGPAAPVRSVPSAPPVCPAFGMNIIAYAIAAPRPSSTSRSRARPRLRGERFFSLPRLWRAWCTGRPARRLRTSSPRRRTTSRPACRRGASRRRARRPRLGCRAHQGAQPAAQLLEVQPLGGVLPQQRLDHRAQRAALLGEGGRLGAHQLHQLGRRFLGIRGVALDRAEEQRAERPQVGGGADGRCQLPVLVHRPGLLGRPAFRHRPDHGHPCLPGPLGGECRAGTTTRGCGGHRLVPAAAARRVLAARREGRTAVRRWRPLDAGAVGVALGPAVGRGQAAGRSTAAARRLSAARGLARAGGRAVPRCRADTVGVGDPAGRGGGVAGGAGSAGPLGRSSGVGGAAGTGQGRAVALLGLVDPGGGAGTRAVRGDRPGPCGPDVLAALRRPAGPARPSRPECRCRRPVPRRAAGRPPVPRSRPGARPRGRHRVSRRPGRGALRARSGRRPAPGSRGRRCARARRSRSRRPGRRPRGSPRAAPGRTRTVPPRPRRRRDRSA
ncbi:hypothetical protein SGLAM104S_07774 [Streptomyces glaucescens]